jgi:hypothetical protein
VKGDISGLLDDNTPQTDTKETDSRDNTAADSDLLISLDEAIVDNAESTTETVVSRVSDALADSGFDLFQG